MDLNNLEEKERLARIKRIYWRANRIIDVLRHRPVILNDGTKITLDPNGAHDFGLFDIQVNDGAPFKAVRHAIAEYYESVDWDRTDL